MIEHICRDAGYSPYIRACRGCMSQLSNNGWLITNKRRRVLTAQPAGEGK